MTNYYNEAKSDAKDTALEFIDNIIEDFVDKGKVSDDLLNDYPGGDSYHHENHVDKSYTLLESAELLDELDEYEENDSGLWEGQKPRDAISTQAAFTYGNAVYSLFKDIIDGINNDDELSNLHDEYEEMEETVQNEYNEKREEWLEDQTYSDEEVSLTDFPAPFDVSEETDNRREEWREKMETRIREIVDNF